MIWFRVFLAGLAVIAIGLVKALRSRKPDMFLANGGMVAATGFMGFRKWTAAAISGGLDQKEACLLLM